MTTSYVLFQSSFPRWMHDEVLATLRAYQLRDETPHQKVPSGICFDPQIKKAIQFLSGKTLWPNPCKHIHTNNSPYDGDWHQDDYDGQPWPEGEWAILFYFPQDTPPEMGGTGILIDGQEVIASGPAGTCLLVPANATHRARANTTGKMRYMLKYLFRG